MTNPSHGQNIWSLEAHLYPPSSSPSTRLDESEDQLVLSEQDQLWQEMRHNHIGQVLHDVTARFREFKGTNQVSIVSGLLSCVAEHHTFVMRIGACGGGALARSDT